MKRLYGNGNSNISKEVAENAIAEYQQKNDDKAFRILCAFVEQRFHQISKNIKVTDEDKEDMLQNVIMKVFKKSDTYNPEKISNGKKTSVQAWVDTIIKNQCYDFLRSLASKNDDERTAREFLDIDEYEECLSRDGINTCSQSECHKVSAITFSSNGDVDGPETAYEKTIMCDVLKDALRCLGTTEKQAITMYYYDDFNEKEITEKLGKSVGAIKMTLSRARNKMKGYLESEYEYEIA